MRWEGMGQAQQRAETAQPGRRLGWCTPAVSLTLVCAGGAVAVQRWKVDEEERAQYRAGGECVRVIESGLW